MTWVTRSSKSGNGRVNPLLKLYLPYCPMMLTENADGTRGETPFALELGCSTTVRAYFAPKLPRSQCDMNARTLDPEFLMFKRYDVNV